MHVEVFMSKWHKKRRIGIIILIISFVFLMAGLGGLGMKVRHDLNTPFQYHLQARQPADDDSKDSSAAVSDGSVGPEEDYIYSVDISKHWVNDPGVPLQTYGA